MKKRYKSWKVWHIIGSAVFFVVFVPLIINEAYKLDKGYMTVWTGSEFLTYYGTILGAAATIIALVGTIIFTRRQILFERYVQQETEKWKEIETLFRTAIILAEPLHLTSMFYATLQKKSTDVCLQLENHMTGLSEAMDCLDVTIEEKDVPKVNDLLALLREIEVTDNEIAKEYDTLLTLFWLLQSDNSAQHAEKMLEIAKQRDEIDLKAKNLREQKYRILLQMKKQSFSEIYNDVDKNSKRILIFDDGEAYGT